MIIYRWNYSSKEYIKVLTIQTILNMKEMNYYKLYLEKFLLDNDLAKRYGKSFVEARSEQASESYELMRRNGCTVEQAQELAMSELMQETFLPEA